MTSVSDSKSQDILSQIYDVPIRRRVALANALEFCLYDILEVIKLF